MYAAIIGTIAHVMFGVDPAQDLGERDGLRYREAGLGFAKALNAVGERDGGDAVVEGDVVGHVDAGGRGRIVRRIGEEIDGVAARAIPVEVGDAREAVIADGVAGLERIRI